MHSVRDLSLFLCAAAGFCLMSAAVHKAAPLNVAEVTPKLAHLRAHATDYDTLFIGSSRVYHGLQPRVFDAEMAAAGKPSHSFNLGIDGMAPRESLELARLAATVPMPRLRRVFIEIGQAARVPDSDPPTVRNIYWQNGHALVAGLRYVWRDYWTPPADLKGRAWLEAGRAFALFARNQFNIGRFAPVPAIGKPRRKEPDSVMLGPNGDGYMPVFRNISPSDVDRMHGEMRQIESGATPPRPSDPLTQHDFAEVAQLFASRGVRVYLLATPIQPRGFDVVLQAPEGVPLLEFQDWRRHPEFYQPDHRCDSAHLNDSGAAIFSRELADACPGD